MKARYDNSLVITIPVSGLEELGQYQRAIINQLSKIEIGDCNPQVKEDVKALFKLLSHLLIDKTLNPINNLPLAEPDTSTSSVR